MSNRETFSIRLKEVRLQSGKNQKDFADMVQSTAATISAYENATKNPSLEIVMKIAEKCNVSIDWLCGLSEQKELKTKINSYKDIALKILELLSINIAQSRFTLIAYEDTLMIPNKKELSDFLHTYEDLNRLFVEKRIELDTIKTWLDGALEKLAKIPLTEKDDSNFSSDTEDLPFN